MSGYGSNLPLEARRTQRELTEVLQLAHVEKTHVKPRLRDGAL